MNTRPRIHLLSIFGLSLYLLDAAYAARKQEEWLYQRSDIQWMRPPSFRCNVGSERLPRYGSTPALRSEMSRFNAPSSRFPPPRTESFNDDLWREAHGALYRITSLDDSTSVLSQGVQGVV
jgi:hypothetical protein